MSQAQQSQGSEKLQKVGKREDAPCETCLSLLTDAS